MEEAHNRLKQNTAKLSVMSNMVLVLLKLTVGLYTGAVSIVSEAVHSAVDLLASVIALYAVKKSDIPPDSNHAYGHGKIENISGAIEALLIILAGIWIVIEAVIKLQKPHPPEFLEYGILLMAVSVAMNYWVSGRLYRVAKITGSHALEADALHLRSDIWTSAGVLGGLAAIQLTGLAWLDPVIAIAVALIVFKAGYGMTRKSLGQLTDISLPPEEETIIQEIVQTLAGMNAYHQLRTRRSGSYRLIDMHLVLDKDMHIDQAHAICDQIEQAIRTRLGLCDVVIHIEPAGCHGYEEGNV